MKREKNLVKNTVIITIGKICTQLITFFLLPLYTSLLSTKEYGIVDLLNTLVSLMLPLTTLQLEQALFRELIDYRNNQEKKEEIISSGFLTVIFQLSIYLVLFLIISPLINNEYKMFLATNVVVYVILSMLQQISRGLGDNKKFALGSFITALFTILFNILFVAIIRLGANGMLLGTLVGQSVGVIFLFISLRLHKYIKIKKYKKTTTKKLLKYSIPLVPNAISWWIFNASDRVIASYVLGVEQNGILAASLKFSSVFITLYNVFHMSWTESIALAIEDSDIQNYFNKTFKIVIELFTTMAIGIIACMPFVFPIMINKKFSAGYGLVPISILASLFHIVVGLLSAIYLAKKNTKAIANTSIISAIINIIVHIALIKVIGLYAAVISSFASYFVMSIYRIIDINKKYIKIDVDYKFILRSLIVFILVITCYYINNMYLNIMALVVAIVYALLINKKSLNTIMSLLKKKMKKSQKSGE